MPEADLGGGRAERLERRRRAGFRAVGEAVGAVRSRTRIVLFGAEAGADQQHPDEDHDPPSELARILPRPRLLSHSRPPTHTYHFSRARKSMHQMYIVEKTADDKLGG